MNLRRLAIEHPAGLFLSISAAGLAVLFLVMRLTIEEPPTVVVDMPPACVEALDAAGEARRHEARADSALRAAVAVTEDLMPANLEGRAGDVLDAIEASEEHRAEYREARTARDRAYDAFEAAEALCRPEVER